ncbi:MAG: c-type cytochrome [Rubrivivax sp.]|nr:c-type cytochrome [Rubrivivax sp.]
MRKTTVLAALACSLSLFSFALQAAEAGRAEDIVQGKCFLCHGTAGESSSPVFPRLAGQNAAYVARQLVDYKSGKRRSTTMQPMVEDLSAEDFKALGAYFASRQAQGHPTDDNDLAQMGRFVFLRGNPYSGVAACAGCHGANGHGTEDLPRLAGQHAQYIENQLMLFNKRERTNDNAVMHGIAGKLTVLEVKAVSAFLSGLQ